ncbi:bifunctional 3'-5' exonuclease/DNA polymerase [Microbacterium immunditiarum]|uniref:DNA-directed DNA polymerase n=1 Tax=Microbacterium immunditiarum TaxID=337480 RepID=A0A7Y9KLP2_9MICO|nr:bifunctional 3'-5' exonuclease/DNA polymerase [Microbacterium immunditiarum]NYE20483.1 DNA polymerase-1 [Microbacterium immunditiarum]
MEAPEALAPAWIVLGRTAGGVEALELDADARELRRTTVPRTELAAWVAVRETVHRPRWVWSDAPSWYGPLLDAGVRVARCHDLRLCHAILRDSVFVADDAGLRRVVEWDATPLAEAVDDDSALFSFDEGPVGPPDDLAGVAAEFERQRLAIARSSEAGRLRLLTAAESAGALIAVELRAAGLPWDAATHDAILVETLGERPAGGGQPARMEELARQVRLALGDSGASLDSQPKLLRSLHRAGILVESTSRWELAEQRHPAIPPLLEYKKLSRLLTANGWTWLDEWVRDGRFRPVYVPGGVVTGRWASSGGGALQLPRMLRTAVRADPGWLLVVADVAQLEPRVLAAMSSDAALADAARGRDLYSGIVESGIVETRQEAKIAILGAMYGATTGDSGRLVPRLRRTFPRAMSLVDEAARVGEDGGVVTTWLGRSSPPPSEGWRTAQSQATEADASAADQTRARRWARDRGRFTRNFVVQGTAAEWALSWLADLRGRLDRMTFPSDGAEAPRSGPVFARHPHLAFFLHDEVIVHTPAALAEEVAVAVQESAATAGRLLFGDFPVDFPLDVRISRTADKS